MRVLHVTDAAAAGVLSAVTTLARAQADAPEFEKVAFRYTPRPESPAVDDIRAAMGAAVDVEVWPASLYGLWRGLSTEIGHGRYDLVHLHSSRAGFLGRIRSGARPSRTRVVYSPHGFAFGRSDFSSVQRGAFLLMERVALAGGKDVLLVSESERMLASASLPGIRARVLPNAVDTDRYRPVGGRTSGRLDVVHVGRLSGQKRPGLFAEIAERARALRPGRFSFTWLGDGDRGLLGPGAAVEVTGWLTRDEVRARLGRASAVLFTSSGEGMPMALLEAQSVGLVVVGSDVVGVRDLVTHGENGFLFDTVDEALDGLDRLLDPACLDGLSAAARARIVDRHCVSDLAQRSHAIYRAFLAPRGRPGADSTVGSHPRTSNERTS
jgi:glycosyltransferase involved in cell wall biosynthesis